MSSGLEAKGENFRNPYPMITSVGFGGLEVSIAECDFSQGPPRV